MSGRPWAQGDARRDAILAFVAGFWREHGFGPTYQEIADGVGLTSTTGAFQQVRILREAGCIEMTWRRSRTIRVVEP